MIGYINAFYLLALIAAVGGAAGLADAAAPIKPEPEVSTLSIGRHPGVGRDPLFRCSCA